MKDVDRIRIRKVYASCPGWPSGGSKEFSSQTQIYVIPCRLQLPTNKWRSAGPGRSLYLLSIIGLATLGGQYHSLPGTEFSAFKLVTFLLPATQADSHAGSKVYIWNVFGWDPPPYDRHDRSNMYSVIFSNPWWDHRDRYYRVTADRENWNWGERRR